MPAPERPQLRTHLAAAPEDSTGRTFILGDELRLSEFMVRLSAYELEWVQLLNGKRTLRDLQMEIMKRSDGVLVPMDYLTRVVEVLDEALLLDSPRFQARFDGPVRRPSCIGAYPGEPEALRRLLRSLFVGSGGSGRPGTPGGKNDLRAILAPHIDYARGGRTYTWAFKELFERTTASLFVIVGTSHYSLHRFTLTRKNFQTPLGVVPTDQDYVDRLVTHYGDGLFADELGAHLPEHSIELEVVFLQFLFEGIRPIRIVPLLVGSFHDCVQFDQAPENVPDIGRMIEALQAVERETDEPICYVISGDLAHIGPKFGDRGPVSEPQVGHSDRQDLLLMERAAAVDAQGYFRHIVEEQNNRRICGFPPTYLTLQAARPGSGRLLQHDRYVHPEGKECVSFAGAAFYT
jgi:AmmeMemoRadiSam system protein B